LTKIVAILNLTPDSFSGDGKHGSTLPELLMAVDTMIEDGADVIDVGAQSTRPAAAALSEAQEWERLSPLLDALGERTKNCIFSLDTYHPENAKRALDRGFHWINDVSGGGVAMTEAVRPYDATLVLMHSLTVPADTTVTIPVADDPVKEVLQWGKKTLASLSLAGFSKKRVILDPGIGFGKTAQQSLEIIKNVATLRQWGVSVLVGHSRKSFLTPLIHGTLDDRDTATLAVSAYFALQGVDFIRVHDVRSHHIVLNVLRVLS